MGDYVIVGDTKHYKGCLVCVCLGSTYESAKETLNQMLTNPTENDKRLMEGHTNFRVKLVEEKHCWWNYGCD